MRLIAAALVAAFALPAFAQDSHYVQGHYRKDGTYVQGHYQSNPDTSRTNNWSSQGNVNPYTGQQGTVNPYLQPQPAFQPIQPIQPIQPLQPLPGLPCVGLHCR